jgi:hypothetical protein
MSRGPGRIQRGILDMIATPEAAATFDLPTSGYSGGPGPVGVPLDALYHRLFGVPFRPVWNEARLTYYQPTRAQYEAVRRAVSVLQSRGLIDTYARRVCPKTLTLAAGNWDAATFSYSCCGYNHVPVPCVGRPRTDAEDAANSQQMAAAMAFLKA